MSEFDVKKVVKGKIDDWTMWHQTNSDQMNSINLVKQSANMFMTILNKECPHNSDLLKALDHVREAMWYADYSIACKPNQEPEKHDGSQGGQSEQPTKWTN